MSESKPKWDEEFGATLIGKLVLVGISRETAGAVPQEQFFGIVSRADRKGIELSLGGSRTGENYSLPPDPRAFFPAAPGSYRLQSTGEVLENPDFTTTWTIVAGER